MAMKKLPNAIQSLFCASTQINNYKRAIEELVDLAFGSVVYNSLDADALSIAIRVNIEENTIQVIDNGCGVKKSDFNLLGQRYTTSKCVDLAALKSAPNKYGFKGQSLASLIEVSQSVKITSRCENAEETWVKVFYKSKKKDLSVTAQRPSKGTTVEIKGFLYNLNIHKRAINSLNEMHDIKSFLEQLSLVHSNISLSLRDETKNEIVFQLHKNRDIYQTLASLFGIDKTDVQELKVEKNQYKVTAYIGKNKDANQQHWIYLNGMLIENSKLNKVVNDNLVRSLGLKCNKTKRNAKSKNAYNEEENVSSKNKIPFYFIFINCPYYDYDVNYAPKKSEIEFKNWEQVNKLLEKLVKFYCGDMNIKEIAKPIKINAQNKDKEDETREQVKKIMEKILRSNPKKLGVSQMQNGIRGKLVKRKTKSKTHKISLSKVIPPKDKVPIDIRKENANIRNSYADLITSQNNLTQIDCNDRETNSPNKILDERTLVKKIKEKPVKAIKHLDNEKKKKDQRKSDEINLKGKSNKTTKKIKHNNDKSVTAKKDDKPVKVSKNVKQKINKTISTKRPQKSTKFIKKCVKKVKIRKSPRVCNDPLIDNFKKATSSVKQRCKMLATKVDELMTYKKKRKRQIFVNETVQYSSVIKNNKNISIRKKVGEIIIHDYVPLPPKFNPYSIDNRVWDGLKKNTYVSTYDLVQTILKSQQKSNAYREAETSNERSRPHEQVACEPNSPEPDSPNVPFFPRQTYESHKYQNDRHIFEENNNVNRLPKKPKNLRFITKQSRDNFKEIKERNNIRSELKTGLPQFNFANKKTHNKRPTLFNRGNTNIFDKEIQHEPSYTIEFSKSSEKLGLNENAVITNGLVLSIQNQYKNGTYTIDEDVCTQYQSLCSKMGGTYTITDSNKSQRFEYQFDQQIDAGSREQTGWYSYSSINLEKSSHSRFFTQRYEDNNDSLENEDQVTENEHSYPNDRNISNACVFNLQHDNVEVPLNTEIEPLNVCETILRSQSVPDEEHESNNNKNNQLHSWNDSLLNHLFEDSNEHRCYDSIFNDGFEVNSLLCDRNAYPNTQKESCKFIETSIIQEPNDHLRNPELSLDFDLMQPDRNRKNNDVTAKQTDFIPGCKEINENNVTKLAKLTPNTHLPIEKGSNECHTKIVNKQMNNFSFKNRHRFVPKGMSPIFENRQSRNVCNYNPEKDYYEKALYNNFANNVQINSEIFEPRVQNVKELTTRDIEKVNNRLNKDNASLIFNGESLKQANVLRQVDEKFIAAIVQEKRHQSRDVSEFLVLFDQHAVDERIRLETNMKDYLNGDNWESITLDDIPLKLSKDEILYLHNYKDKFTQFGLQWTVLDNSNISIQAIPKAILGKNPRDVEVVIKAVKNLISEEINAIKSQRGCVSLYPKSIMDLVFNEACRYAIKFGNRLSKHACMELLQSLCECKTPFQCAHGRPVMAVIMEIKREQKKYELTLPKVYQFMQSRKKRIN